MANAFAHGTVHEAGEDLQAAVRSDSKTLALWESLTPLGRNEFICWVEDAKQPATRQRRIERTGEELLEGKKRPCCWVGCMARLIAALGDTYAKRLSVADLRILVAQNENPATIRWRAAEPAAIEETMKALGPIDFKGDTAADFCRATGKLCHRK
ncbi:MAG: YdeI/OmpD-associated family protein [Sphingomonas bacterium]